MEHYDNFVSLSLPSLPPSSLLTSLPFSSLSPFLLPSFPPSLFTSSLPPSFPFSLLLSLPPSLHPSFSPSILTFQSPPSLPPSTTHIPQLCSPSAGGHICQHVSQTFPYFPTHWASCPKTWWREKIHITRVHISYRATCTINSLSPSLSLSPSPSLPPFCLWKEDTSLMRTFPVAAILAY